MQRRVVARLVRRLWIDQSWMATFSSAASSSEETSTVSFGTRRVDPKEKPVLIGNIFSNVAERYDLMNDLMSFGIHRLWKDYYVSQFPVFPKLQHLDVAGGTGDIASRMVDRLTLPREASRIVVCDLSKEMVDQGKRRAERSGKGTHRQCIEWVVGDAEALPFEDGTFDSYSIAFGIRNTTHMDIVLREAHRVLKPGGFFACLEFSHVENPVLSRLNDIYSLNIIPLMGQMIVGDRDSYQYLVDSIRQFPKQEPFAATICRAGFGDVAYENLTGGIVAIHSGRKAANG